jgi:hypothetical protein
MAEREPADGRWWLHLSSRSKTNAGTEVCSDAVGPEAGASKQEMGFLVRFFFLAEAFICE